MSGYVYEIVAGDDDTFAIVRSEPLSLEEERARAFRTLPAYEPRLESVFPIRDPAHPHCVHPDYANPQDPSRCASQVRIVSMALHESTLDQLWTLGGHTETFPSSDGRDPAAEKNKFREQILAACRNELEATLRGQSPPSQSALEVIRIRPEHCRGPEEAAALVGQYGVVLSEQGFEDQPTLAKGRILCFFSGARKITHAPHPGGNLAQYVNSAFRTIGRDNVFVDQQACNTSLHPATVELCSADGRPMRETMFFLALYRELQPNEQILLDYGPY